MGSTTIPLQPLSVTFSSTVTLQAYFASDAPEPFTQMGVQIGSDSEMVPVPVSVRCPVGLTVKHG